MAWQDTLLDATFRDAPFQCSRIGRAGQRSVAEHEFPYLAGAELEDMNLGPRRVRLQAIFFGDSYEDELAEFIDALEVPGTGELVHPIHGAMTVLAQSWEDEHDAEFVDGAIVNVIFVEDSVRELVFESESASGSVDAISSAADDARAAADGALDGVMDGLQGGLSGLTGGFGLSGFSGLAGLSGLPSLSSLTGLAGMSGLTSIASGVVGAVNQVKGFVSGGLLAVTGFAGLVLSNLDPILYPRAYAADLVAMVDRGFQGFSFGGRNVSFVAPSAAATAGGLRAATNRAESLASAANGVAVLADFNVVRAQLNPARVALSNTSVDPALAAIVSVVQAHAQIHMAAAIAEATAIVFAGEVEKPLLARSDVELLTGRARADIQVAIDAARAALDPEGRGNVTASLAAMAASVQSAARVVINLRPPLVRRASPVSGPVRLVAHAMYGSPDRAVELSALNQLGRHVLIGKGDMLYAYSR